MSNREAARLFSLLFLVSFFFFFFFCSVLFSVCFRFSFSFREDRDHPRCPVHDDDPVRRALHRDVSYGLCLDSPPSTWLCRFRCCLYPVGGIQPIGYELNYDALRLNSSKVLSLVCTFSCATEDEDEQLLAELGDFL